LILKGLWFTALAHTALAHTALANAAIEHSDSYFDNGTPKLIERF